MAQGIARHLFPRAMTPEGMYSFHDYIIPDSVGRILCLRGGPGVGKSTFMRKLGASLIERGFNVDFIQCAVEADAIDGLIVPGLGLALLDDLMLQLVAPKLSGVEVEDLELGGFWDEEGLRLRRDVLQRLRREYDRQFALAARYLKIRALVTDELEEYIQHAQALDIVGLNALARQMEEQVFAGKSLTQSPVVRHMFASAVTHAGPLHFFPSLFGYLKTRIVISGPVGSGKSTLVQKLCTAAVNRGFYVEAFHCSLYPQQLEHLIIPALDLAVVTSKEVHHLDPQPGDIVVATQRFVDEAALQRYADDRARAALLLAEAHARAVHFLARAKAIHEEMEAHYRPNLSTAQIHRLREATFARILNLAKAPD